VASVLRRGVGVGPGLAFTGLLEASRAELALDVNGFLRFAMVLLLSRLLKGVSRAIDGSNPTAHPTTKYVFQQSP